MGEPFLEQPPHSQFSKLTVSTKKQRAGRVNFNYFIQNYVKIITFVNRFVLYKA